jgi:long-chain fatty acid transport protein
VSKALAGAGAAYSQDAMTMAINPAGLVHIDNQAVVGAAAFSPMRSYSGSGTESMFAVPTGAFDSDNEFFLIPNVAASYRLDDASVIGIALYGNGGMNTEWPATARSATPCPPSGGTGVFCAGKAGVDLTQLFFQPTYAREIFDGISVGVGPIFAVQAFEATGLASFAGFSADSSNLSNNKHDLSYGFGGRVGVQAEVMDGLRVGGGYQFRTYMTEFEEYAGLFAEQGDFDIPPAVQVGVSFQPIDGVTLLFDYRHIWYSDVAAVGNPGPRSFADLTARGLGGDNGVGFGWEDVNIFKFAAQWEIDDAWTLRAGYSLGENPIPSSEVLFNILAPGVIEHHFTAGLGYKISDQATLNVAGFYAPTSSVSGVNPFVASQTIEIEMDQLELSLGLTWNF